MARCNCDFPHELQKKKEKTMKAHDVLYRYACTRSSGNSTKQDLEPRSRKWLPLYNERINAETHATKPLKSYKSQVHGESLRWITWLFTCHTTQMEGEGNRNPFVGCCCVSPEIRRFFWLLWNTVIVETICK